MGLFFLVATLAVGQADAAKPARVTVLLPSEARLYVDGQRCPLTSDTRSFNTAALPPGRSYFYILKAVIERDGRTVEVSKKVILWAGKRSVVDFGDLSGKEAASSKAPDQLASLANYHVIPKSSPPSMILVRMGEDAMHIMRSVMMWQTVSKTRMVKDRDGNERPVRYTVAVPVFKWVAERMDPKTVRVVDAEGQVVSAERLPDLLARNTVALLSNDGNDVNPVYRGLFRKETLVLVRSPQVPAPPAIATLPPPPPPKGAPAPVEGPPPTLCLVRADDPGNLHIRQCQENACFQTAMKEVKTEEGTRKVPYSLQYTMLTATMKDIPGRQFTVYDTDGEQVVAAELPKLLHREQVVLLSMDGKKVDSIYLREVKKGTLVLVPSEESSRYLFFPMGYGGYAIPAAPTTTPAPTPTPATKPLAVPVPRKS